MKKSIVAGALLLSAFAADSASAQSYRMPSGAAIRSFALRPSPAIFYQGVRGYSRAGWEAGRFISRRQYGVDPGNYPGFRRALGW